jgi:hypothetical protein
MLSKMKATYKYAITFCFLFEFCVKKINLFFHEQFSLLNWHIFGLSTTQ